MQRRRLCTALTLAIWVGVCPALQAQALDSAAVQAAAQAWLQQVDSGNPLASWQTAAAPFRTAVTAAQWQLATQAVRSPLGLLKSRKDKSIQFTRSLPGAPDGQYAVLQFDTAFENKSEAVETLTAVLEADGVWRVTGYFIR